MDTFWMSYVCSIYVVFPRGKLLNHIVWKAFVFGVFWWKVSVFGVFLVCIFPHLDWKRRDTIVSPNVGKYGLEKLRIRTLFMQWHVTRILLFEEVFSNFLLSIWFFVAIYYLFLCSFYCRNEFPFRELLTYSLHISFHSFNKFYFSLMLYISLLVYLLLRLQFENPNEIYSKVFPRPIHPNSGHVHIWHKFKCKYFWMSGKLPPVRVRVWFRISARIRDGGQFS